MAISITNGTLTQVQSTLSPASGYDLPDTVTVSGATSNYNSTSGQLTLTSPTSSMSVTATGKVHTTVTDLTNTVWLLNTASTLNLMGDVSQTFTFALNYSMSYSTYQGALQNNLTFMYGGTVIGARTSINYPAIVVTTSGLVTYTESQGGSSEQLGDVQVTISITGGTDVTNTDLIVWLEQNATQQIPPVATKKKLKFNNKIVNKVNTKYVNHFNGETIQTAIANTPAGYSGNIIAWDTTSVNGNSASNLSTLIKFDTAPSNTSDYDVCIDKYGDITGSTTFTNKSKVYVWCGSLEPGGGVKINNVETYAYYNYDGQQYVIQEITLTGNYDIYLAYHRTSGGHTPL